MLIQGGKTKILLDAGLHSISLQKRLAKYRIGLKDLDAVFLTHEHGDHARSAETLSRRYGVPVYANPATLTALAKEYAPAKWSPFDTNDTMTVGDLNIESFAISHDAVEPVGYNIYCKNWKVSFVTDTGVAGPEIGERIEGADLAIVEANHDVERLMAGPYPQFLKQRIHGKLGHLSNDAAADLILKHLSTRKRPTCIWLGHLSDTNNTPRMARRHVQRRLSEAGFRNVVLDVALKDTASLTWRPLTRAVQLDLFDTDLS
jgi:phosphoribosyl 1,2-cyclic phosphodiesterase